MPKERKKNSKFITLNKIVCNNNDIFILDKDGDIQTYPYIINTDYITVAICPRRQSWVVKYDDTDRDHQGYGTFKKTFGAFWIKIRPDNKTYFFLESEYDKLKNIIE